MIRGPRSTDNYPDRQLECEEALEDDIIVAFDDAASAGWSTAETAMAIVSLVENYLMAQGENAKTEFALLRARICEAGARDGEV